MADKNALASLPTKGRPISPAQAPAPANLPAPAQPEAILQQIISERSSALTALKSGTSEAKAAAIGKLSQPAYADKTSVAPLVAALGSEDHLVRTSAEKGLVSLALSAAKSSSSSHLTTAVLEALTESLGRRSSNDDIRTRLSARCLLQDTIYALGQDAANRGLLAPVIDRLANNSINGPEKVQGLSKAALDMAAFNQSFDDNRKKVFGVGPEMATRETLPSLISQAYFKAGLKGGSESAAESAAAAIAGLAGTLPAHTGVIEGEVAASILVAKTELPKGIKRTALPKLTAALSKTAIHPGVAARLELAGPSVAAVKSQLQAAILPNRGPVAD